MPPARPTVRSGYKSSPGRQLSNTPVCALPDLVTVASKLLHVDLQDEELDRAEMLAHLRQSEGAWLLHLLCLLHLLYLPARCHICPDAAGLYYRRQKNIEGSNRVQTQ